MLYSLLIVLALFIPDTPTDFGRAEIAAALSRARLESRGDDISITVTGKGEPESFVIRFSEDKTVIEAADESGALYGALELAERIREQGAAAFHGPDIKASPFLRDRGLNVFITLPWDYEKNNTDYAPAALTDPEKWWFQNDGYWKALLDRMARSRLNWLDLHGTWDVSVTNAPNLYAYFIQSDKYPEIGVAPEIKAANLDRLNRVIDAAHSRGIRVSLMAYEARIQIPQNPNPPYENTEELAYDYTREVVEKMIRQCPGLDMIGFRIGESGRSGEFFNCYLEAVERSGREIPLYTRSWVTRKAKVVPLARGAADFTVEIKYNGEHWAAPYQIAGGRVPGWYSYSFEDYLSDSGDAPARKMWYGNPAVGGGRWPDQPYKVVWQVRANGTHRIFPFYNPDWVRRSINAMKIGTAAGFTVEPLNAYYPASPRYYTADLADLHCDWIVERDAAYLMLWGRLGYDPYTPDDVLDRAVMDMLGCDALAAASLVDAWKSASLVIPTAFCAYSLGPDHRSHAPELEWGGGMGDFIVREPFDSHAFMSVKEALAIDATGGVDGRIRPQETALMLSGLSRGIREGLDPVAPPPIPPPVSNQVKELRGAMKMLGHLADYYGSRLIAACSTASAEAGTAPGSEHWNQKAGAAMEAAATAWLGLCESGEATFYRPFTERLRMHTNTFHWRDQLAKVRAEAAKVAVGEGSQEEGISEEALPAGGPRRATVPASAHLSWRMDGDSVLCSIPALCLDKAWLLHKPLPSSTFFHKTAMTFKDARFVARFQRENHGHMIAADVACDNGAVRRIPCWEKSTPYTVIPARAGPTPPIYTSQEAMTYLDPDVLDPQKHGMLLLCSRAWDFHRRFELPIQRKLLQAVERGMTLLVLQQDYTSGRFPLTWLPRPPKLENRPVARFDPDGALGLDPIETDQIMWQPFVPAAGWEVFGNGGVAKQVLGKGEIWMVQARLMQNMHFPECAKALVHLLKLGGVEKPAVVVDAGTEGAHYATSVFIDMMNAHEIPFLTLGEVVAKEQGMDSFEPKPGRLWDDNVLEGNGPAIMKAFIEAKVKAKAARPFPGTSEAWDEERADLKKEMLRCFGLDPLPERCALNAKVTGVLERDGYRIEKIVFESRPGFPVTAHLYVPDGPSPGDGYPVIVNPHGHWASKKAQPEVQSRAIFQALRGYLALVVDSPGYSFEGDALIERRYAGTHFDPRLILGSTNAIGIYVWDLMRAVDYLETRPEADMSRVGITGASGGGHATLAAFSVEERLHCAVPVCYATSMECNPYNGCNCNHVPGMLQVGDRAHMLALRAPAPVLVIGADDDWEFPPEGTRLTGEKLKEVWALYGREKDAGWLVFEGEHGYSKEMREAMIGFFDAHLLGIGDGSPVEEPEFETEPADSEELLCIPAVPDGLTTMRDIAKANLSRAKPITFEEVVELNGGLPEREQLDIGVFDEKQPTDGSPMRRITFETEPGLIVPGVLVCPREVPAAVVVLVSENGKAAALDEFPVVDLVENGIACLLVDVRGFGELPGLDPTLMSYLGTADPFAMGWDAACAARAMHSVSSHVAVVGRGTCGAQIAMFAALMEPDAVSLVVGLGGIRGYGECFLDEVPTYSIQPRASHSAPLSHLRSLVKQPAVWTFMGEQEPNLVELFAKWAGGM